MTLSIDKKTPSLYLGAYAKDSNDMVGNIIPTAPDNPSKVSVQQKGKHAFPSKQQLDMPDKCLCMPLSIDFIEEFSYIYM